MLGGRMMIFDFEEMTQARANTPNRKRAIQKGEKPGLLARAANVVANVFSS